MKIDLEAGRPFPSLSTSITDISFLLTIFFVITAVFMADMGIFIALPRRDSAPRVLDPDEAVSIEISAAPSGEEWEIIVDAVLTRMEGLEAAIRALRETKRNPVAVIAVGEGVPYQKVLDVVEEVKRAGISTFSLSVKGGMENGR
jgi:biopolymer transport protein TolR